MRWAPGRTRAVIGWLIMSAANACGDSSVGPSHRFTTIAVGDTVQGHIPAGGGVNELVFAATTGSTYAVFVQSLGPTVDLTVSDTARGIVLASASASTGLQLLDRGTAPFQFGHAPVLLSVGAPDSVTFRVLVYPVQEAPESRSSVIAVGDTVREPLETLADIDTFVVSGTAGEEVIAYAQALNAASPGALSFTFGSLASIASTPGDSDLEQAATGRIALPVTRDYRLTLQSATSLSGYREYRGPYRFLVRPVQRAPERHAATLAPGDSVADEAIDYVGDVDEFELVGTAGQDCIVFFQALTGSSATRLELDLVDTSGTVLTGIQSGGTDGNLLGQRTGAFVLPAAGSTRVRVAGVDDRTLADRGAYRFWVYAVHHGPETAGDTIAYGDSMLTEAIDLPGDIDEFAYRVPDSTLANLVLLLGADATGGSLMLELDDSTGQAQRSIVAWEPGSAVASGRFSLNPGAYRLRVMGFDSRSAFVGHYQIKPYVGFTARPEAVPDTIVVGDTVQGERLTPPGDQDVFHVHLLRGQHIDIGFGGLGPPGGSLFLFFGPQGSAPSAIMTSPTDAGSVGASRSGRIDIDSTGWYVVAISGDGSTNPGVVDGGPYGFAVTAADTLPEHVGSDIAIGDTVSAERIDYPGDFDRFVLTATPGQTVAAVFQIPSPTTSRPILELFDLVSGDSLAAVIGGPTAVTTGLVTVPASGQIGVRVLERSTAGYGYVGAYQFVVIAVNPAPETVSATFAVGDTIRGEAVFPGGDVDEFTSTAPPGSTLAAFIRLTADPVPAGEGIALLVIDPGSGAVLAGSGVAVTGASAAFLSPGSFVVPPSGTFRIRVRAYANDLATAPYEFFVRPVP